MVPNKQTIKEGGKFFLSNNMFNKYLEKCGM